MRGLSLTMAAVLLAGLGGCDDSKHAPPPNRVVLGVNDPFCRQTESECVAAGHLREYEGLARRLSESSGLDVQLAYFRLEAKLLQAAHEGRIDGVICRTQTGLRAGELAGGQLERLADVSMPAGPGLLCGVVFVRADSPIQRLEDLTGRTVAVGPPGAYEKSDAARALLARRFVRPKQIVEAPTCMEAAVAVHAKIVDAAVISSYAFDYGTLDAVAARSEFREIGRTAGIPFVSLGVFDRVDESVRRRLAEALAGIAAGPVPADLGRTRLIVPARPWPVASKTAER